MPHSKITSQGVLIGIILSSGLLYIGLLNRKHVGAFSDDAVYIAAAQSLLQGRYVTLHLPNHPPITDPLPGFPLFLAPWVAFLAPHWRLLRLLGIGTTLLSGWPFWMLSKDLIPAPARTFVMACFLWNPAVAAFAPTVMSEPFFMFLTLMCFYQLRRTLQRKPGAFAWLAAMAAWASLVRPHGIVILPALVYPLLREGKRRTAAGLCAATLGVWGAVLLRNYALTGMATGYLQPWGQGWASLSGSLRAMLGHTGVLARLFLVNGLGGAAGSPAPILPLRLTDIAVLLGVIGGTWIAQRTLRKGSSSIQGLLIFLTLYLGVHILWHPTEVRYILPAIPIALLIIFQEGLIPAPLYALVPAQCLLGLVLGLYLCQDSLIWRETRRTQDAWSKETYAWVRSSTPPTAFVLASNASELYLETGRLSAGALLVRDGKDFRYWTLKHGISHVFLCPASLVQGYDQWFWDRVPGWLAENPDVFQSIYRNPKERTQIFTAKPVAAPHGH